MKLSIQIKNQILQLVLKQEKPFNSDFYYDDSIMFFLESIWDLKSMPSTDIRFTNAYDDIYQHIVNNEDWEYEYLFVQRLNLLGEDSVYELFLNNLIHPDIRLTKDGVMNYVYLIQPYLEKENLSYNFIDNKDGIPVYELGKLSNKNNHLDTSLGNKIPFYVSKHKKKINTPENSPYFLLDYNDRWNDYGVWGSFSLLYYENDEVVNFGSLRIVHINNPYTIDELGSPFYNIGINFCSLGQSIFYYKELSNYFGNKFESILYAINDSAFFIEKLEKFENKDNFNSCLIRSNEAERLLRQAKYEVYNYDLSNLYSFTYYFSPKFASNTIEIEFDFKNSKYSFDRVFAIIGKNGTGKTQLITSLPLDISNEIDSSFKPKTPLFSNVIAVSYSAFDSFEIPSKSASFNYHYCGLKNDKQEELSDRALLLRFHNTRKKIDEKGRTSQWIDVLSNFLEIEIINQFIKKEDNFLPEPEIYKFDIDSFTKIRKQLSSGQSIILYIITEIIANIRFDSIILYDEPETHLHPNAISQLINTIYQLVEEFQSYCIITTHSPLIIREIISKNVFIIERENDYSSIRKIGLESFGENLSVITSEVFGNKSIPKQYQTILKKMVSDGLKYIDIKKQLKNNDIPLSINADIYLKSLFDEKY
ncbi:AbiJ-related protein [Aquimarina agarilytica]|uniref:AbiJ-related protein n=1 Tax=Aquimarina agarilytica TaxID=1087449 RepID=UPI000287CEE2|nr:AAA family ATPase [Aquimarina agarilytica]